MITKEEFTRAGFLGSCGFGFVSGMKPEEKQQEAVDVPADRERSGPGGEGTPRGSEAVSALPDGRPVSELLKYRSG